MSRGFFTIAQGELYQRLAYAMALSLKATQPEELSKLTIGVARGEKVNPKYAAVFDNIVKIPWRDAAKKSKWKLENEWKSIYMTPYDETIKLDADMLFPANIASWWNVLGESDGVFTTKVHTYRGEPINNDFYRKTFTESSLPNVYTAFFYFKKNETNFELFKLAEFIFNNWERSFYEFLLPDQRPRYVSTDVVFAIAAKIMDYDQYNKNPHLNFPTFVHMKSQLQGWPNDQYMNEDWTKMIPTHFNRNCDLKIGNFRQSLPLHYHVKDFIDDRMITLLEKKVGI